MWYLLVDVVEASVFRIDRFRFDHSSFQIRCAIQHPDFKSSCDLLLADIDLFEMDGVLANDKVI